MGAFIPSFPLLHLVKILWWCRLMDIPEPFSEAAWSSLHVFSAGRKRRNPSSAPSGDGSSFKCYLSYTGITFSSLFRRVHALRSRSHGFAILAMKARLTQSRLPVAFADILISSMQMHHISLSGSFSYSIMATILHHCTNKYDFYLFINYLVYSFIPSSHLLE